MKTLRLLVAGLLITATGFAQTAFTQATLNEILAEYQTNSKAFFMNRLSADFRYTTRKGLYQNRGDIVSGEAQKILKAEIVEPVIFQSGDLAVVSGIHKTERSGSDGNPVVGQVACTYTFQRRAGKWLFVASQQNDIAGSGLPGSATADEAAIKAAIEGESMAFHQRQTDKVLSYWANVPYASHYYTEKGVGYVRGYDAISKVMRQGLSRYPDVDKAVYKNHDYLIQVNGTSAWATFITDVMDGDKKRQTHDTRYLEKADGIWKLVSVTSTPAL